MANDNEHKCLILCAGLGTRLRPFTLETPKPLAPVCNRPLFDIALSACLQTSPSAIAINTHHLPGIMTQHALGAANKLGIGNLHVSLEHPEILGTGGALRQLSTWWGDSDLLVYNGDIISDMRLDVLLARHRSSKKNLVTLAVRQGPPGGSGRSIWMDKNDNIKFIARRSDLEPHIMNDLREFGFACAYVATREFQEFLPKETKFHDVIDSFNQAIAAGFSLVGVTFSGLWADVGDPRALWETNLLVAAMPEAARSALIGPSSRIASHTSRTCNIDKFSVVAKSVMLGNHSSVKRSVLLEGASIAPEEVVEDVLRGCGFNISFKRPEDVTVK